MKIKKFLIAKGNLTLLAWNCPKEDRGRVSKHYLREVEQVGFVTETKDGLPQLKMMGDELCVNATLALASELGKRGKLYTSGLGVVVKYVNFNKQTCIELPLSFKREKDIVLFEGIGYKCTNKKVKISKGLLVNLAEKYKLPAFGIAVYNKNQLTPYVYVKETDSLFQETACGSGSIAISIVTGINKVIQPTGEIISVVKTNGVFRVCAEVEEAS